MISGETATIEKASQHRFPHPTKEIQLQVTDMGALALTRRALSQRRVPSHAHRGATAYFQSRRTKSSHHDPSKNPSIPSASFKDLGASRTVKIVVVTFLAIAGTMETIAWTKFLWMKFGASADGDSDSDTKE
ncbi:hypothetical protein EG329_006786 [Mollisiaceae sp. DMI_Dod_QoI]|nr:hypothetical protein EG329_006786 [Helotiales sp. DMI_Dod_QoI]